MAVACSHIEMVSILLQLLADGFQKDCRILGAYLVGAVIKNPLVLISLFLLR